MVDWSCDTTTTARHASAECCAFVFLFASVIASNIFSAPLADIDGHAIFCHKGRERKRRSNSRKEKDSSPAEKLYFLFCSAIKKKHSWNSPNQLFCLIKIMDWLLVVEKHFPNHCWAIRNINNVKPHLNSHSAGGWLLFKLNTYCQFDFYIHRAVKGPLFCALDMHFHFMPHSQPCLFHIIHIYSCLMLRR